MPASEVAHEVVAEIEALGGEAVANGADVADFEQAAAMVQQAIDTFGGLDILVNNAGFVRDRMLVNTSEEEWDAVIRVHLKGHFAPLRHAGAWWRTEAKEGRQRAARVVNTSSGAGMQGSIGQTTYSAAKAGIAGMTLVAAAELGRYGVNVNAIAPVARTRMTEGAFPEMMAESEDAFDAMDPANNSPVVAWLASEDCDVTGRVIEIEGGQICVEEGWRHGPKRDLGRRWEAAEVGRRRARADRRRPRSRPGLRRLAAAHPGLAESWPPVAPYRLIGPPVSSPPLSAVAHAEVASSRTSPECLPGASIDMWLRIECGRPRSSVRCVWPRIWAWACRSGSDWAAPSSPCVWRTGSALIRRRRCSLTTAACSSTPGARPTRTSRPTCSPTGSPSSGRR